MNIPINILCTYGLSIFAINLYFHTSRKAENYTHCSSIIESFDLKDLLL